jgi:hypothetical protein
MGIMKADRAQFTNNELEAGVHENIVIKNVDISTREGKDGIPDTSTLLFITFAKLNEESKLQSEKEIRIWKMDHAPKKGSIHDNTMRTVRQLYEILLQIWTEDQLEAAFDPFTPLGIIKEESVKKDMQDILSKKTAMDTFNQLLREQFLNCVAPVMGLDSSLRFKFKLGLTRDGSYKEMPLGNFIERMGTENSKIELTTEDLRRQVEAMKPIAATTTGNAPVGAITPSNVPVMPIMGQVINPINTGIPSNPVANPIASPVVNQIGSIPTQNLAQVAPVTPEAPFVTANSTTETSPNLGSNPLAETPKTLGTIPGLPSQAA